MITIYTFETFWAKFHYINPRRKSDKARCRNLWDKCNFKALHKKAISEIIETDITSFEYLKSKLNEVQPKKPVQSR